MSQHTIAVLASSLDEGMQQALASHADFRVVTCDSLSTVDDFFREHSLSLVCLDSRAFGAAWAVVCAHWIERILRLSWQVPLVVISDEQAHWHGHHHPFLHPVLPDITAEEIRLIALEHDGQWERMKFSPPIELDAVLARFCRGGRSFGARVFLAEQSGGQDELWLEVALGRLWRVSFGDLHGVIALRQVMGKQFVGASILEVDTMPLPANVVGPWQSYVPTKLKVNDGSGDSWGGLATRTDIERRNVRELLMGLEERLEQKAPADVSDRRDTPQVPIQLDYDEMRVSSLGLYAPLDELRRLCELLLEGEQAAAAEKVRYIRDRWPDEPALRLLWVKMLL